MGSQRPGMWILVPVVAILSYLQVPKVEGALTISKEVYGPLGGSTTLQCKDTTAVSGAATWYFNTINLIAVDGIKYSEIGITSGFGYNLTIANLRPSDEGNYHCEIGIDAAIAVYLPIEYRPGDSDINIDDIGNIITIKSYPSPTFTVVAKNESGTQILNGTQSTQDNVTDNTKTTTWRRLTSLSAATYTFIVTVSAPGNRIKEKNITIDETVLTSSSTSNAQCETNGALLIILIIFIIISVIILVILYIALIIWIKNSNVSIFKPNVKTGHRCRRILYLVLLITVVVCAISIIIIIIVGRQCQVILGVGLGLGLFIIIVTCIFVIVFIKTEVIIRHKDTIRNPKISTDVKITASLRQIFISDVKWILPKGKKLTTEGKYIIAPYTSDSGETSLTIKNVSQDDNGSYICQAKNGFKIAKDSIHILCAGTEKKSKNTGTPAFYIGKQNKVGPETTSMQINERRQPFPPVGGVVEDKLKRRPQPPPPENIDAKDLNLQELPANYKDAQGLPTGTPLSNRLTPLIPKQATVQEKDSSKGTKKKRKKKKKKGEMNVEKQEEGMEE